MYQMKVNGSTHSVDVDGDTPLLWVLRDVLGLTGAKFGWDLVVDRACHRDCGKRLRKMRVVDDVRVSPPIQRY